MRSCEGSRSNTHVLLPVSVRHAAVQPAVLEASQVAVVHQEVQDGRHLAEDENLEHHSGTLRVSGGHGETTGSDPHTEFYSF